MEHKAYTRSMLDQAIRARSVPDRPMTARELYEYWWSNEDQRGRPKSAQGLTASLFHSSEIGGYYVHLERDFGSNRLHWSFRKANDG